MSDFAIEGRHHFDEVDFEILQSQDLYFAAGDSSHVCTLLTLLIWYDHVEPFISRRLVDLRQSFRILYK